MASELQGVAELTAKLNALGVEVAGKNLRGAARAAMKIAFQRAQSTIPQADMGHYIYTRKRDASKKRFVWPGFALRSLRLLSTVDKKTGAARAVLGVRKDAFYAVQFVEFGTSRAPAQPWLRNALENTQSQVLAALRDDISKRLDRLARAKSAGVKRHRRPRILG